MKHLGKILNFENSAELRQQKDWVFESVDQKCISLFQDLMPWLEKFLPKFLPTSGNHYKQIIGFEVQICAIWTALSRAFQNGMTIATRFRIDNVKP